MTLHAIKTQPCRRDRPVRVQTAVLSVARMHRPRAVPHPALPLRSKWFLRTRMRRATHPALPLQALQARLLPADFLRHVLHEAPGPARVRRQLSRHRRSARRRHQRWSRWSKRERGQHRRRTRRSSECGSSQILLVLVLVLVLDSAWLPLQLKIALTRSEDEDRPDSLRDRD